MRRYKPNIFNSQLHELIGNYLDLIKTYTFPANNLEFQTVPPEWEEQNPKHLFELVSKLHELAGKVVKTHQKLIRKASLKFES